MYVVRDKVQACVSNIILYSLLSRIMNISIPVSPLPFYFFSPKN